MSKRNRDFFQKKSFISIFRNKAILLILVVIFFSLSVTIAIVTYYGQHVGNFVISIEDEASTRGIALSETNDFSSPTDKLIAGSLTGVNPIRETQVIPDFALNKDGSYISNGGNVIGYTFYLMNTGTEIINIDAILNISSASSNVDAAIRIWYFVDYVGTVYMKPDEVEREYPESYSEAKSFLTDRVVMNEQYLNLNPGDVKKISIIMWIEGEDPDCTDLGSKSIVGGTIKLGMSFEMYQDNKKS